MTILVGSKTWKRERPLKTILRACEPTQSEQDNVRAMVVKLRAHYSSWSSLAKALGVHRVALAMMRSGARRPTVGLALRLARLTETPVDSVLSGRTPAHAVCPNCGADLPGVGR